ncbi:MAG: aminopeptidase N [Gammaproteobacteria bacterium]
MTAKAARPIRLADYRPPAYQIEESDLTFDLGIAESKVRARHRVRRARRSYSWRARNDLTLHAEAMRIDAVRIDGAPAEWAFDAGKLVIKNAPQQFDLAIENTIHPARNTALSGLYHSGGMLCTQCEAEGFRRITPSLDRPDNLSKYTVTLRAEKKTMPLLLSNGNLVEHGDCGGGMHYARWHDPFPKPAYLFAVVAGDLARIEDHFTTAGGRRVSLRIYANARDIGKCEYAMESLKRAFAWDEKAYGREYDLDVFNLVAVDDFNMGAMENKSLNIFNTQYVQADAALSTDADFEHVEAVVAHEYFHNWSGNRVTCRDWFQLSLKEGFTVFREQQFCADAGGGAAARIEDAADLRNHQFREDAGPMAHAVRPQSYVEINNFYTATVYNKGAEVIRMLHTLLGADAFRRGADLYFARHDGQAVTTDDFVAAMESAARVKLRKFKNWYSQAGTPRVSAEVAHDAGRKRLCITLTQTCGPTPGQPRKAPFVIPLRMALFAHDGRRIRAREDGADELLVLSRAKQKFVFKNIAERPVVSLLRGFSAPVELRLALSESELAVLLAHDDDAFSRWEAGQKLFMRHILAGIQAGGEAGGALSETLRAGIGVALDGAIADPARHAKLLARLIALPGHDYIAEQLEVIDPAAIFHARRALKRRLAAEFQAQLTALYAQCAALQDGAINAGQIALRELQNACLDYLLAPDAPDGHALAEAQFANARCMTDSVAALSVLGASGSPRRAALLDAFYARHRREPLLVNKWLRIQACAPQPGTHARVEALTRHPAFEPANPNKVYALLLAFSHANPFCFHAQDGRGYRLISGWVARLDRTNPQVAARLASAFTAWKKYTPALKTQMQTALREIAALPKLSRDVAEIAGRSLQE